MAVTVKEVAEAAGVSLATVSRVLNGTGDVAEATAEKVRAAAAKLGYERDASRGGRPKNSSRQAVATGSFALLIPDEHIGAMHTPLSSQLVAGAEEVAADRGSNFILTRLTSGGALPPILTPPQVDGVIIRMGVDAVRVTQELSNLPTVFVLQPEDIPPYGDMVHPDNEAVGQLAANYLKDRGNKVVAIPNRKMLGHHTASQVRREAFLSAAARLELRVEELTGTDGSALYDEIKNCEDSPTGIFLPMGEEVLESLFRAIAESGQAPCDTLDMISCNNDPARLGALSVRLPNIDIRAIEVGKTAAEQLLWRAQNPNEPQRRILVAPALMPGQN